MIAKITSFALALTFVANFTFADQPTLSEGYESYPFIAGDSLAKIADKYLKSRQYVNQLVAYNGWHSPYDFVAGKTIIKVPFSISKNRVAKLTVAVNTVSIIRGGNTSQGGNGMTLLQGDQIQTGPGAKAEIQLDEGSVVRVGPDTQFSMSNYGFNNGQRDTNLALNQGSMQMRVTKLSGASEFRVSTVTAVAGVRGTFFYVNYDPKSKQAGIAVYSGKVEVGNSTGDKKAPVAAVTAGNAVTVTSDGTPSKPFPIPAKIEWAD